MGEIGHHWSGLDALVRRCSSVEPEQLGPAARKSIRSAFLDSLGTIVLGADSTAGRVYSTAFPAQNSGDRTGCSSVAWWPEVLHDVFRFALYQHSEDFDDTGGFTQGHPSVTIVPVIAAISKALPIPGPRVFSVYAASVEVFSRLARSMPLLHMRSWHATSLLGPIASAVAAAKLLCLNDDQLMSAVSISASLGGGVLGSFGTITKSIQVADSVRSGCMAALMARAGATSSPDVLVGPNGLLTAVVGEGHLGDHWLQPPTDGSWVVEAPGLNIKRHSSCALSHRLIDAMLQLRSEHGFTAGDVARIDCWTSPRAFKTLRYRSPVNSDQARFSVPYLLSAALLYGRVTPSEFSGVKFENVLACDVAGRVSLSVHADWTNGDDNRPDRLVVALIDGRCFDVLCDVPLGHALNPMGWPLVVDKFLGATQSRLGESLGNELVARIEELDSIPDVAEPLSIVLDCL